MGLLIIPILEVRKLRPREVKSGRIRFDLGQSQVGLDLDKILVKPKRVPIEGMVGMGTDTM